MSGAGSARAEGAGRRRELIWGVGQIGDATAPVGLGWRPWRRRRKRDTLNIESRIAVLGSHDPNAVPEEPPGD